MSDNHVLMHLDLSGNRISEIAERAHVSKQAISKLVTDLERRKIVTKQSAPNDSRAQIVRFTKKGNAMMLDSLEVVFNLDGEFATAFPKGRLDKIRDDLEKLLSELSSQPLQ